MRKGKYAGNRRTFGGKQVALLLALVLLVGCAAGGTLAWLLDTSEEVTNTFTTSTIGVELDEADGLDLQMIPGWTITKDPWAKVTADSEDCYLFVKVEKSANFDTFMNYAIDSQWTVLDATKYPGVYYMVIDADTERNVAYNILGEGKETYNNVEYTWADNQVLVKPTVTKQMMTATDFTEPTLTFTAYASQLYKNNTTPFTPADAWAIASAA